MKIKIIDLLNMIAKGEDVPKKIKFHNINYEWYSKQKKYYVINFFKNNHMTLGEGWELEDVLNDEVEIIEDKPKEIKKFQVKDNKIIGQWADGSDYWYTLSAPQTVLALKMLELIDKVNEMSKDD